MEDALARGVRHSSCGGLTCLNPCFNGRCTRTLTGSRAFTAEEICLNPCFNGRCTRTSNSRAFTAEEIVLILVLMEDALAHSTFK